MSKPSYSRAGLPIFFVSLLSVVCIFATVSCTSCIDDWNNPSTAYDKYSVYEVNVKSVLNVRDMPSIEGKVVRTMKDSERVLVTRIENGWAKIYSAYDEYVLLDYLVLVKEGRWTYEIDNREKAVPPQEQSSLAVKAGDGLTAKPSEISLPSVVQGANVLVYDNAGMLSDEDRERVSRAFASTDIFIMLWTTDSLDRGAILSYPSKIKKQLSKEPYASSIEEKWSEWTGGEKRNDRDRYLITYSSNQGLMQIESDAGALKYLVNTSPDKLFSVQKTARNEGLCRGVEEFSKVIADASVRYAEFGWVKRTLVFSADIGDALSDFLKKSLLIPSQAFLYKYLFSWLIYIPNKITGWLMLLSGSIMMSLIVLCLAYFICSLVMSLITKGGVENEKQALKLAIISLVKILLYVSMFSLIIYTMCDFSDITAMRAYEQNEEVLGIVEQGIESNDIQRTWWLAILFFIGMFFYNMPKAWNIAAMTLPPGLQQKLAQANKTEFIGNEDNLSDEMPFVSLVTNQISESIGNSFLALIALSIFLNGLTMLYVTIFTWILLVGKISSVLIIIENWSKKGYYNSK